MRRLAFSLAQRGLRTVHASVVLEHVHVERFLEAHHTAFRTIMTDMLTPLVHTAPGVSIGVLIDSVVGGEGVEIDFHAFEIDAVMIDIHGFVDDAPGHVGRRVALGVIAEGQGFSAFEFTVGLVFSLEGIRRVAVVQQLIEWVPADIARRSADVDGV